MKENRWEYDQEATTGCLGLTDSWMSDEGSWISSCGRSEGVDLRERSGKIRTVVKVNEPANRGLNDVRKPLKYSRSIVLEAYVLSIT